MKRNIFSLYNRVNHPQLFGKYFLSPAEISPQNPCVYVLLCPHTSKKEGRMIRPSSPERIIILRLFSQTSDFCSLTGSDNPALL